MWRITENGSTTEKVSLHATEDDFVEFLKAEIAKHPKVIYRTEAIGLLPHASKSLYTEVMDAKSSQKYGIWKDSKELAPKS